MFLCYGTDYETESRVRVLILINEVLCVSFTGMLKLFL